MSTTLTSPVDTGEDRGAVLMGVSLAFGIASALIVMLRIGYRLTRRTTATSDMFIALAMVLNLVHSATNAVAVTQWGWGKHEADLPSNIRNAPESMMYFWLALLLSKPCLLFTKLSLFFAYRGLFEMADTFWTQLCRGLNYFTAFLVVTYYGAAFLATVFECTPIDKMWYPNKPGNCINKPTFFYATDAVNVTTSLLVILIPLPVLLIAKHQRSEVTQVLGLILLGFFDTIISVVRMFTLASAAAARVDFSWTIVNAVIASSIEMSIAIITASLIVMRPCLRAIYRLLFFNGYPHSTLPGYNPSGNVSSTPRKVGVTNTVQTEMAIQST